MAIQNPNSCGQGFDPFAVNHPLYAIVTSYGYRYSHSAPITALDGTRYIHHTFKHGEHNVGVRDIDLIWNTSVSCASGRQYVGKGANELSHHLKLKMYRYHLSR